MKKFLLSDGWLEEIVLRLDAQGCSEPEIANYMNSWVEKTIGYILYLGDEGFSDKEIVSIVNHEIDAGRREIQRASGMAPALWTFSSGRAQWLMTN